MQEHTTVEIGGGVYCSDTKEPNGGDSMPLLDDNSLI